MIADFHFLRPYWLLALLPLIILIACLFNRRSPLHAWSAICDTHLLPWLIHNNGTSKRAIPLLLLGSSGLLMIISLSGPTWSRLPVATYQQIQPRVLVLDMTPAMLARDLTPNRLSRAKFKLHDLFQHQNVGQFGLVVYTGEAFVVSPLTDDGQTIDALLSSLTPDIMPVTGSRLDNALEQARDLITQAGFNSGQILVLTGNAPSQAAIHAAKKLAQSGIDTSIIPVSSNPMLTPSFTRFASAGHGHVITFTDTEADLNQWLTASNGNPRYGVNLQNDIPIWNDQGRWFLIPALLLFLPVFRRGWLQRIAS